MSMEQIVRVIRECQVSKRMVFICGNGGLAAEAEHFAAELMGKFGRNLFIPCIALTTNSSLLTALANDFGYEQVFAHQVNTMGQPGDVLIGMTTSASVNIRKALEVGKQKGMTTICLCGPNSPDMGADILERAKTEDAVAAIQQDILSVLHYVAYNVKRDLV